MAEYEPKIHFERDGRGRLCGTLSGAIYMFFDWRGVSTDALRPVTCKNCIKKLVRIGFSPAHFKVGK